MVSSKILKEKIQYKESRRVDEEDIGYNSSVYDYEVNDKAIEIVLGKEKHNYTDFNVIYYPVYLYHNEDVIVKIGIFEIAADKMIAALDEDGDIDIDKGNILLFSFMTDEFLDKKMKGIPNSEKSEVRDMDMTKPKEKDETREVEIIESGSMLDKETKELAMAARDEFVKSKSNSWIEQAMTNNNYNVIDTPGDGDCFFSSIQKAFELAGKKYNIIDLRKMVSSEMTQETFDQYKMLYLTLKEEGERFEIEMKEQKKTNMILKKRHENTLDRKQSDELIEEADDLHKLYKTSQVSKDNTSELMSEFAFMEGVDSVDELKNVIETSSFWADSLAISILEYRLNIRTIILSKEYYESGDVENILLCTQINDDKMMVKKPTFYIMVGHNANHYDLITYKGKGLLKYQEIPYDIKTSIVLKCMERNAGIFYEIDEFKKLKDKLGSDDEPEEEEYGLYNDETVFMIHSKANSKPKTGKGTGEKINNDEMLNYHLLNKDKCCNDWRKKLNDDWLSEFKLDGKRWYSVNHYMYGNKYKNGFPDFYYKFSLDSDDKIAKDLDLAKHAISKTGKYKQQVLREPHIKEDSDIDHEELRKRALTAKFTQNADLEKILKETKDAKIMEYIRGGQPKLDILLMQTRKAL